MSLIIKKLMAFLAISIMLLLTFGLNFVAVHAAEGTIYYISRDGDDGNSGTSPKEAWQSVERINKNKYGPGDQILFQGGQRFELKSGLNIRSDLFLGNSKLPVSIGSYGKERANLMAVGKNPIIDITNTENISIANLNLTAENQDLQTVGINITSNRERNISGITIQNITTDENIKLPLNIQAIKNGSLSGLNIDNFVANSYSDPISLNNGEGDGKIDDVIIQNSNLASGLQLVSVSSLQVFNNYIDGLDISGQKSTDQHIYKNIIHDHLSIQSLRDSIIEQNYIYGNSLLVDIGSNEENIIQNLIFRFNIVEKTLVKETKETQRNKFRQEKSKEQIEKNKSQGINSQNSSTYLRLSGVIFDSAFYVNTFNLLDEGIEINDDALILVQSLKFKNNKLLNNIFNSQNKAFMLEMRTIEEKLSTEQIFFAGNNYFSPGEFRMKMTNRDGKEERRIENIKEYQEITRQEIFNDRLVATTEEPKFLNNKGAGSVAYGTALRSISAYQVDPSSPLIDSGVDLNDPNLGLKIDATTDFYGNSFTQAAARNIGAASITAFAECVGGQQSDTSAITCASLDVNAGELTITAPSRVILSSTSVSDTETITSGETEPVFVQDLRGNDAGWSAVASITNFVGDDNTAVISLIRNSTSKFSLAPNTLSVADGDTGNLGGLNDATNVQDAFSVTSLDSTGTSNNFTLASFSTGNGAGRYQKTLGLNILIPPYTKSQSYRATLTSSVS